MVGTGDGSLISGQCWMGTKRWLCPGSRDPRDLLEVTGPLNSALLGHSITGLMWPGIHGQTPVPSTGVPGSPSPWEGRRHVSLGVWLVLNTHRASVWLPCLYCWQLLPVLLLTSIPGWGARGWVPLHRAGTLHL